MCRLEENSDYGSGLTFEHLPKAYFILKYSNVKPDQLPLSEKS
jgi:hypothetical protein